MKITREWLLKYSKLYDREYKLSNNENIENCEKERLRKCRFLKLENLVAIGRWKSPRAIHHYESNDNKRVTQITRHSFAEKSENARIESLLRSKGGLKGVGYPVASTILHFAFPDRYAIMDFRVIRSLDWEQPSTYTFDFWQCYCQELKGIADRCVLTLREVEKALWKYDKEQSKRSPCR
jgi:hypothetical protein